MAPEGAPRELEVMVRAMRLEALDVMSVELRPVDGTPLPTFSAGSHIDVSLPSGITRSYSLTTPQGQTACYTIAVALDPNTRGGSKYICQELRVGQRLRIATPRNNFPLCETPARSLFIAGGIGVTPFCSMLARLNELRKNWVLYYCTRTRAQAAYLDRLRDLANQGNGELITNFDGEPGGVMLDIAGVISREPADAHFYCCGPAGMLQVFRTSCAARPAANVHFEYFNAEVDSARSGGFEVVLARSGRRLQVSEGSTILETLRAAGLSVVSSCEQGICGACEVRVLSGQPEHRDQILSDEERQGGKVMMICCSGSRGAELVLDL